MWSFFQITFNWRDISQPWRCTHGAISITMLHVQHFTYCVIVLSIFLLYSWPLQFLEKKKRKIACRQSPISFSLEFLLSHFLAYAFVYRRRWKIELTRILSVEISYSWQGIGDSYCVGVIVGKIIALILISVTKTTNQGFCVN